MAKITTEMIQQAYETAKRVYAGALGLSAGRREVCAATGMGTGSAADYIINFRHMMEGRGYTRTMNLAATEYFLEHIGQDFGREQQRKAARAVAEHVAYYQTVHSYLAGTDRLARRYL